ncbi:MAG: crotonase/enoyl-CoA hydratase family protein [Rhizobiales bacterium]|nr:crotonase/enoyl-CoA hydratase family protein [Hyphomicrobiales bacterium]
MTIEITHDGPVQVLRFARPEKRNAVTGPMYAALADALVSGDADPAIAAHVFAGTPGAFCAGNDLSEFLAFAQSGALGEPVLRFLRSLATTAKPLVAAVDGLAVGIGTTLLFHCDLVYASDRSSFRTPFVDLALVPEAASSLLMPARMGHARAFEMLALGDPYSAAMAREAGFVNAVTPPDEVEHRALEAARRLATKPAGALAATRRLLRGEPDAVLTRIDREATVFAERLASPEARAAFAAFLDKRGSGSA